MGTARWIAVIALALVGLVSAAFTIQNSSRVVDLSLDLGLAAWHLQSPVALPWVLWATLLIGLLLGLGVGAWMRGSSVRRLQQEVDRARFGSMDDPQGF